MREVELVLLLDSRCNLVDVVTARYLQVSLCFQDNTGHSLFASATGKMIVAEKELVSAGLHLVAVSVISCCNWLRLSGNDARSSDTAVAHGTHPRTVEHVLHSIVAPGHTTRNKKLLGAPGKGRC